MDDKKRLIELITGFYGVDPMYYGVETQPLVDHLIANGVTIQQHGHWEMINHSDVEPVADYACSVCSGILIDVIDDPVHDLQAYCPMCGAKMEKTEY